MVDHRVEIIPILHIPEHLSGEVQSKLAYVDEWITKARVIPASDRIELILSQSADQERLVHLEEKVQRVVVSMVQGAIKPKIEILEDHLDRLVHYQDDPHVELIKRGEIAQEAAGLFTLGPLLTRLIDVFETLFLKLAESHHALPYRFPTLIPARYLDRVNYFRAFPHSLTFVTHLREDLDIIDHFSQHACCDENGRLNASSESYSAVETLLSPAVCYHLYFALADRPLPKNRVIATAVGNCFRYESTNLVSLERLWNFTMREIIFIGSKEFVLENRESALRRMSEVFEKIGLAYCLESANDPFFIGEFRRQAAFQSAFQLKYEMRALLPFKQNTLAVGSYNYHQDFFGRHLNIALSDGTPVHTGCVAFGLERIAYAFLAQFSLNPIHWPSIIKGYL